ncbi:MAG: GGDEF domain-containing protein [Syntrophaceae bacterium]|nr:GGDEF domain-containing protein [Syntrophaceae bacterium]
MQLFGSLAQEKFRKLIFIFFVLSSLIPILIVIFIGINYVLPDLTPDQTDKLRSAFTYGLLIMFLFPSLSFFLLSQWMGSLENLTEEIKSKSAGILKGAKDTKEETNEITTIRNVVDGLHAELQDKMNQLNEYSKKLIDFNIELSELSITDDLIGLFNRRHFDLRLKEEIDRSERYGHGLALIMIDVDGFKQYNDILGHQAGDVLLKKVSIFFQDNTRKTDIPFRYGGDEFAIILTESTIEGAVSVAHKLSEVVSTYVFDGIEKLPFDKVTISCGVANYSKGMADLLKEADRLLYEAKNAGKGRVRSSSGK